MSNITYQSFHVKDAESYAKVTSFGAQIPWSDDNVEMIISFEKPAGKKRTNLMNASLHRFLSLLAESLNDAGWTVRKFLNAPVMYAIEKARVRLQSKEFLSKTFVGVKDTPQMIDAIFSVIDEEIQKAPGLEAPWSTHTTKELLWRPIYTSLEGLESTADADTTQYSETHKVINQVMGERYQINYIPWPSQQSLMDQQIKR